MASPFETMMAPDAAAQAAALERLLRERRALGMLGQLSGDKVLSPVGRQVTAGADAQEQAQAQAAQQLQQMMARQAQEQARQQFEQRKFEETQRHNRAVESRPTGQPALTIVTGEGGAQFLVDPRNPAKPAAPVLGPDGKPIAKPKAARALQTGDKAAIEDLASTVESIGYLEQQFRPEFAGGGPLGGVATSVYQKLGSAGTEGMQKDAAFWAEWDKLVNLPERNAIFGASLSAGEKSSWEGARTIKPGSSPDLIRAQLQRMKQIAASKLGARTGALKEEGYDPEAIDTLGRGMGGQPAPAAAPVPAARRFTRVNGKLVEVK